MKPKRIFLVRHGESEGNVDVSIYKTVPDYALQLTEKGKQQSIEAGQKLKEQIKHEDVAFYVSPMWRTRMTFEGIAKSFKNNKITVKEDPRLREQEWGHLRDVEENKDYNTERDRFGIFYYRFQHGESGADVYDRISDFLGTLFRDFEKDDFPQNAVLVTHGLSIRLFLMRWFHYTVEEFEEIKNPYNCQIFTMELQPNGKYKLLDTLEKHTVVNTFRRPMVY